MEDMDKCTDCEGVRTSGECRVCGGGVKYTGGV